MDKLIDAVLDSASGSKSWDGALDVFAMTFGARSAVLQGDDAGHVRRELLGIGEFFRETAKDLPETYENKEDEGDERLYQRLAELDCCKLMPEHELLGVKNRAEMPPSPFRQMLIDRGLACRAGAVLNQTGPTMDVLGLFFESEALERKALTHPDLEFAVRLMSRSVALNRVLASLKLRYEAALNALDFLGLGVFLVTSDSEIMLANRAGRAITDDARGLTIDRANRLSSQDDDSERTLRHIIADVARTAQGKARASGSSFTVSRGEDVHDLLVSVAPLSDAAMELEADLRCAFVLVIDPEKRGMLDASGIALLGGLTEAETHVAGGLVDGLRVNEIAEQRDTSPHTVRGQIKNVAAKLRCSSQADIIRLAAATRLPFTDSSDK